jgi:uncharacterized protein
MAVFADAFYWIALTSIADAAHERAKQYEEMQYEQEGEIVTTEEVLTEYLNYFHRPPLRDKAGAFVAAIASGEYGTRIIHQSHISYSSGLTLYRKRPDKEYSLTDCISMETMRTEGLTDVLTSDHHFEQEGFVALLRDGTRS